MPEAESSDVRIEIDTVLEDSTIETLIGRVAREIEREYDDPDALFDDTQHRQDFEATLTALRIAEGLDRRAESVQSGRTSTDYETAEIENLRKRVRRLDPGAEFGHSGQIIRDTSRTVTATNDP